MKGDCTPRGFEHVGKPTFSHEHVGKRGSSVEKLVEARKSKGSLTKAEEGLEDEAPVLHPIATLTRADALAGKTGGGSKVSWKLN
jgi:uncharacterized protein (DUF2461 family)